MTHHVAPIIKTTTATILTLWTLSAACSAFAAAKTNALQTVPDDGVLFLSTARDGRVIWDLSRVPDRERTNLEFPYLIRFKDRWFCSFREGNKHGNDPSGRARVITSEDGEAWETAVLLEWEGGDIRDPRMSITADGQLMINSSIYFIGEQKEHPADWEEPGKRQSVTWLSEDGWNWTGPYACPTGFDTWRWDVAWHDGYGYSAGYSGKDRNGTLYRTKDGKQWEVWVENFFDGPGTEAALAFGADGIGYCLLRGGGFYGKFAVGQAPDYREWEWHPMQIDAACDGIAESGADFGKRTGSIVGGEKLLRLSDGRLVAITAKGGTDLFWVEPERSLFTRFARMSDGASYPGLAEYNGEFWITNSQRVEGYDSVKSGIYLVRVNIPPPASLSRLLATAAEVLANEGSGFGALCRDRLYSVRTDVVARQEDREHASDWIDRTRLLKALAECREARELKEAARTRLAAAREMSSPRMHEARAGFVQAYRDRSAGLCEPLKRLLANEQATIPEVRQALAELDAVATALDGANQACARAEDALAGTSVLQNESVQGFARLYQAQVGECAERLRAALVDPTATTEAVQYRIESLFDVVQTYRKVDRDVLVHVTEVIQLPTSIACGTADDWGSGLLMDVAVSNDALEPARQPVLSFGNGVRTSVRVGNPPEIAALREAFTITAWAFPKSTEESYRTVLDKGGRDAAIVIRQARTVANWNVVSVRMYAEAEPAPNEPYQVSYGPPDPAAFDHRWHHYAATYDGEALRLYVDGQLVGASPKQGRADLLDGDLVFGCLASGGEPWMGYIAGVAVWKDALPGPRIASQMQRVPQGDEKGLVGYWPLNEGEGDAARDMSGRGNDGQIGGGTWAMLPVRRGMRLSNPVQLDADLDIATCAIEWEANVDGDSAKATVDVLYGISETSSLLPEQWTEVANGAQFAVGGEASVLAGKCLWVKQVLTTEDPALLPRLSRLNLRMSKAMETR